MFLETNVKGGKYHVLLTVCKGSFRLGISIPLWDQGIIEIQYLNLLISFHVYNKNK